MLSGHASERHKLKEKAARNIDCNVAACVLTLITSLCIGTGPSHASLLDVGFTERWVDLYFWFLHTGIADNDFSKTEIRIFLKANPNTTNQIWWGTSASRLGLYSNPGLYNPWVWSTHVEALHQTTFVDVGRSLDGGQVCCQCGLRTTAENGLKRWCCVIHHNRCWVPWDIFLKVHGDTNPGETAEPECWKFNLFPFSYIPSDFYFLVNPATWIIDVQALRCKIHLLLVIFSTNKTSLRQPRIF